MSARFTFELGPVLEMRARTERDHQLVVAALERERMAIEQRLAGFQRAIGSSKEDLRSFLAAAPAGVASAGGGGAGGGVAVGGGAGPVALGQVRLQASAAFGLTAKAHQAVLELAGLHRRLEAARAELLRATTARKAVELLRARRYEQWLMDQKSREFAELDEINVTRAARTGGAGGAEP